MAYNLSFNTLWETDKYVAFLDRRVPARFISEQDDQKPTPRQIELLDSLDQLTSDILPELVQWAQKDLYDRLSSWGLALEELEEELGIEIDANDLQKHFSIDEILVPRIGACKANYIFLAGQCDWDPEHGIEFLLKDGHPILCGPQEGLALSEEWDNYLQGNLGA